MTSPLTFWVGVNRLYHNMLTHPWIWTGNHNIMILIIRKCSTYNVNLKKKNVFLSNKWHSELFRGRWGGGGGGGGIKILYLIIFTCPWLWLAYHNRLIWILGNSYLYHVNLKKKYIFITWCPLCLQDEKNHFHIIYSYCDCLFKARGGSIYYDITHAGLTSSLSTHLDPVTLTYISYVLMEFQLPCPPTGVTPPSA